MEFRCQPFFYEVIISPTLELFLHTKQSFLLKTSRSDYIFFKDILSQKLLMTNLRISIFQVRDTDSYEPLVYWLTWLINTVKSIKRSPLGQINIDLLRQDKKRWPFNTGDCLIEVTTWAGFTVQKSSMMWLSQCIDNVH